jgi:hypothetical protein
MCNISRNTMECWNKYHTEFQKKIPLLQEFGPVSVIAIVSRYVSALLQSALTKILITFERSLWTNISGKSLLFLVLLAQGT